MYTLRFKGPSSREEAAGRKLQKKGLPQPMTPRQKDVYLYVRIFWEKYGYRPTQRDIGHALGIDRTTVCYVVKRLVENGVLAKGSKGIRPAHVRYDRLIEREKKIEG